MADKRQVEYHEMKLQFVVVKNLRLLLPPEVVWWYVNNGGKTNADRIKNFKLGEHPGASDLMVFWNRTLLCPEIKVRKSELYGIPRTTDQSKDQKDFQALIEAQGGYYEVCRSVDEVMGFLTRHGVPTRETAPLRSASLGVTA